MLRATPVISEQRMLGFGTEIGTRFRSAHHMTQRNVYLIILANICNVGKRLLNSPKGAQSYVSTVCLAKRQGHMHGSSVHGPLRCSLQWW